MRSCWRNKSQGDFLKKGYGRYLHRERIKYINRILDNITTGSFPVCSERVLIDLGCGEGVLTTEIYNKNLKIIGTDYDMHRIKKAAASSKSNESFLVSDITKTVFKPESADIIILHHVIEHLEGTDGKIIEICRNILKKGGWFIVGIPNENSFLGRLSRLIHKKLYARGEHVNFYCEKSITQMFSRKGFVIKSVGRVGFIFPFYYVHMVLIAIKPVFYLGNWLTRIFKTAADSLIIVCKKSK